ncbi:MAG: FAD-dependent oxidoreductase [Nitrosopumilus sp.]|nr:FAD-dependent oxidoreductase [Nitrosopumilus sp.]MDA7999088.1 FAD-dependent oxidoreductase [Nitrosopumilus sp.]
MYDVVVVGGGVLGACVSYWISATSEASVCVMEKEAGPARHASGRNTGVVHTPFYMDPGSRGKMARASLESRPMWRDLAERHGVPWLEAGLYEAAATEAQHAVLERHARWAARNGVDPGDAVLLDGRDVARAEPGIRCHSALHAPREACTDYAALTRAVRREAEKLGVRFAPGSRVDRVREGAVTRGGREVGARLVINCAGGSSLQVARSAGLADGYTALHFRGEYWISSVRLAGSCVYSVPTDPRFPFLDPHWICRAGGGVEVGPNAVPVAGPEAYEGIGGPAEAAEKLAEVLSGGARRLVTSPAFVELASREWLSSVSKSAMVSRLSGILPGIRPGMFRERGTAGIRSPVVDPAGRMLDEALELAGPGSYHVLNYNSPGATGAPAYARDLVGRIRGAGLLPPAGPPRHAVWR